MCQFSILGVLSSSVLVTSAWATCRLGQTAVFFIFFKPTDKSRPDAEHCKLEVKIVFSLDFILKQ